MFKSIRQYLRDIGVPKWQLLIIAVIALALFVYHFHRLNNTPFGSYVSIVCLFGFISSGTITIVCGVIALTDEVNHNEPDR